MKNKGFTLVELLAVVVLLSLLALLVIPKVLEQKENKEKELTNAEKAVLYSDTGTYIREKQANDIEVGKVFCIHVSTLITEGYVSMDAEDFKRDIIKVTVDENNNFIYKIDNNCTASGGGSINKYKEAILNGADPVLKGDMVAVTIDNDGTVKKADVTKEWYKYADKKWANAVVLADSTSYSAGDTIPEAKIKAYYVWIPRYKYQLFNSTSPIEIQITFENKSKTKSNSTTVGKYLTHPAFTYGNKELNGFWVGKFMTTGTADSPTIKPFEIARTNQDASTQYETSLKISKNSRMIKNIEWGAVAYLSHSKYGLNGNIRINNQNSYYTGCGANINDGSQTSACQIKYGNETSYPQSTTGNINGVFDMSGGCYEYTMGVLADSEGNPFSGKNASSNSGFNGKFGSPGSGSSTSLTSGKDFPNIKNYNLYDNPSNRSSITGDNGCNGSKCYGHALTETKNWYDDSYTFPTSSGPWILRSGNSSSNNHAGIFYVYGDFGGAFSNVSFHAVVTN